MTYAFRSAPSYPAARRNEVFASAFEQPLSAEETFFTSARSGALESFGLGTVIRDFGTPRGEGEPSTFQRALRTSPVTAPFAQGYEALRGIFGAQDSEPEQLSEDEYKSSAFYRAEIPWDAGMTKARAEALASWYDAKKVREFYSEKRPFASFLGYLGGQALDPINYIPVAGPLVKGAAVARLGVVGGHIATASLDAAANTAAFGLTTAGARRAYGDDVSWQSTVSQIATAALIGAAFGGLSGGLAKRAQARLDAVRTEAQRRIQTLRSTQEARIALNEAVDGLASKGEVELTPNAVEPLALISARLERTVAVSDDAIDFLKSNLRLFGYTDDELARMSETQVRASHAAAQAVLKTQQFRETGIYDSHAWAEDAALRQEIEADLAAGNIVLPKNPTPFRPMSTDRVASEDIDEILEWAAGDLGVPVTDSRVRPHAIQSLRDAIADGRQTITNPETMRRIRNEDLLARLEAPGGTFEMAGAPRVTPAVDTTAARPDPTPEGRAEAEVATGKPDDMKAVASQYRVDPETGAYPEEADLKQLETEGRLTDGDKEALEAANENYANGDAWGKALRAAVSCLI